MHYCIFLFNANCPGLQNAEIFLGFGNHSENCFRSWWEDTLFPFPFCKKESDNKNIDIELKRKSWRRRVDVNMSYYCGSLIIATLLHVLYKYPLKDEDGIFADWMRNQFLSCMQFGAAFCQLMIIVGLCLDGGQSMTSRENIKS